MSGTVRGPLRYGAFRRALAGRAVSSAGSWMQTVAAGWLIHELTGSALAVGVLAACSRGPAIFLSTYGGSLADRFDRRRLTMVLYGVQVLPPAALTFLALTGSLGPLVIYALTLVLGIAGALASPGLQEVTIGTVRSELVGRATAISSASYNIAGLIGPAAGGGLLALAGPAPVFAVNAASFGFVVLMAATLPRKVGRHPDAPVSMRSAAQRARSHPLLRTIFPLILVFSLAVGPVQQLAPALADRYGSGAHLLGLLLSALAVGGLIAVPTRSLLAKRGVSTADALGGSMVLSAAAVLLLAASTHFAVAILAMVLCGIGWDVLYIIGLTGVQVADKRMSGLMTGLFFAVMVGGVTVGALIVGGLFDVIGISEGLIACAAVVGGAGLLSLGAHRLGPALGKGLRRVYAG